MSWYRDSDGKIITDEEFQSDCYECSVFCSEGTITIPCNGERTDCPHFKEVDTSDYDKEIRSKVIEEFAEKCKGNVLCQTFGLHPRNIDEIAEQMNDRCLFKAKSSDTGEWVIGSYHHQTDYYGEKFDEHYIIVGSETNTEGYGEHYIIDKSTLCQCTGLKDKNGNLIWENDVVIYCDCTEERYVIAWEENKACFEYQQYGCSIMNFDELSGVEVEVIGSIFDNPELLQVE